MPLPPPLLCTRQNKFMKRVTFCCGGWVGDTRKLTFLQWGWGGVVDTSNTTETSNTTNVVSSQGAQVKKTPFTPGFLVIHSDSAEQWACLPPGSGKPGQRPRRCTLSRHRAEHMQKKQGCRGTMTQSQCANVRSRFLAGSTEVSQHTATMYHGARVRGVENTDELRIEMWGNGGGKGYGFLSHIWCIRVLDPSDTSQCSDLAGVPPHL